MTDRLNRRHLLATAAAVPLLPVAAHAELPSAEPVPAVRYGPDLDAPGINWPAVRERITFAGEVLDIPAAEVRNMLALPEAALNDGDELTDFAYRHGVSLDWLIADNLCPMMRASQSVYLADVKRDADPAVAAYERWLETLRGLLAVRDDEMDGPEYERAHAEEWRAAKALADARATTAAGAAGKMHLMLYLAELAGPETDLLNPKTFTNSNWADQVDVRCAQGLWRDLRELAGEADAA